MQTTKASQSAFRRHLFWSGFACMVGAFTPPALAQEYPTQLVRFIVPNTPGASMDILTRVIAAEIAKDLKQPTIVENRPGASERIGTEYVAKQAPADGYTVLGSITPSLSIWPVTVKDLRFDPLNDIVPVIGFAESHLLVATGANQPWKTLPEMVAALKKQPGKYNYGASSIVVRIANGILLQNLGLEANFIPYNSGPQFVQAILAGDINFAVTSWSAIAAIAVGDRVRVLAYSDRQRLPQAKDAPTFAELKIKDLPTVGYSYDVRAGTPKVAIDRLYAVVSKALKVPEIREHFVKFQLDITNYAPDEATKMRREQSRQFAEIAKKMNLQLE